MVECINNCQLLMSIKGPPIYHDIAQGFHGDYNIIFLDIMTILIKKRMIMENHVFNLGVDFEF